MPLDEVRAVLRALAEARDREFYELWVLLTRVWPAPLPGIGFRIYQVADSTDSRVVVHVNGTGPDGTQFTWTLAVMTSPHSLFIEGSVDMRTPEGDETEVFTKTAETSDYREAASIIRALASEVCRQRAWLT